MSSTLKLKPQQCPLFQDMVSDLQRCFERNGVVFDEGGPVDMQVWDALRSHKAYVNEGYRAVMNRFLSVVAVGEKVGRWWEVDLWERTVCALEQDYLRGRKLTSLVKVKVTENDTVPDDGGTTNLAQVTASDRVDKAALRDACANAMAISVLVLGDKVNQRLTTLITAMCEPVKAWHSVHNRVLRRSDHSADWVAGQVTGDYMSHVADIIKELSNPATLQDGGFAIDEATAKLLPDQEAGLVHTRFVCELGVDRFASQIRIKADG